MDEVRVSPPLERSRTLTSYRRTSRFHPFTLNFHPPAMTSHRRASRFHLPALNFHSPAMTSHRRTSRFHLPALNFHPPAMTSNRRTSRISDLTLDSGKFADWSNLLTLFFPRLANGGELFTKHIQGFPMLTRSSAVRGFERAIGSNQIANGSDPFGINIHHFSIPCIRSKASTSGATGSNY